MLLTPELKKEYQQLFDSCQIHPQNIPAVDANIAKITPNQARYQAVGEPLKIPWYFVAIIHCMESSLKFDRHLHNGDPLTARTVHVPKNRPIAGNPPFTWEQSATDALIFDGVNTLTGWSVPDTLFAIERYNGFGYRIHQPAVLTPYLWGFSNHYIKGKFTADGSFSKVAISKQCGAAVLLKRLLPA